MKTFKIITVVGARPQFVKAAVVSRAISKKANVEEVIVHTGQHFDAGMSDVFFDEMEIPKPKYNLDINGLGHGAMTGQMLEGIEKILIEEKADALLIYGDTNSTLAGALAAKKIHIPVIHVEAGLRSFNMDMPEEVNRILSDRISTLLFPPTDQAVENLMKEGYEHFGCKIIKSGDVMYDAALFYSEKSAEKSNVISKIGLDRFVLCTVHRAENTDDIHRLKSIFKALNEIHENHTPVVLPLHPRTKKIIADHQIEVKCKCIDPVGYFDMIELLKHCEMVMSDSGGLQKEAYFFKKACVTLRDQTEWVELISNGFNLLAGADYEKILSAFKHFKTQQIDFNKTLYGTGNAGELIIDNIINELA